MSSVGPLHKAMAPSYFTFGSHAAMFVGFTPGVAAARQQFLNPKFGKLFRLEHAGFPGQRAGLFMLSGPNIITGFNRLGYVTIGTGAVPWFNPDNETGQLLSSPFEQFYYSGNTYSLAKQLQWIADALDAAASKPVFLFLNVGETHVPYYFEGAPWSKADNPCVPFQTIDRSADCRIRQTACIEFVDHMLGELLSMFSAATIVLCADHGDCWGENGLWEHGISHDMTFTVPLIVRVAGHGIERVRTRSGSR
ncbi:MAG: sulfatase-like hydrolase/transferase [Bryobacteraceae bacterium]